MTTPAIATLAEVLSLVPPPAEAIDNGAAGSSYLVSSRACLLYGWSAMDSGSAAPSQSAYGSVTAPGAGATIATLTPGAGTWEVTVATHLVGASAAVDASNMALSAPGFGPDTLIVDNSSPSVPFENGPYIVNLAAAQALTVTAIAAGTAGVAYQAQIIASQVAEDAFSLYDGRDIAGQLVTTQAIPRGGSASDIVGAPGILCRRGLYIGNVGAGVRVVVYIAQL